MTLQQWCDSLDIQPTYPTTETGAVSVLADRRVQGHDEFIALWHLEDYAVSTRSGCVVWLVPKAS